ncbi:MAG: SMODS domain-containing nucleotidyltransferase [Gammaproteobacteria bacterium]
MTTFESNFEFDDMLRSFASKVEPSRAQKQAAAKSHKFLRDLLEKSRFGKRLLPSYLSGSYSRETAIYPIDDVDIIFPVDPTFWPSASFLFASLPEPAAVIQSFATAIRRRYKNSSVYRQRRSVCLQLYHLDIDAVPAVDVGNGVIQIPDCDSDEWIRSAPLIHRDVGVAINSSMGGGFKLVVKLLKSWNSQLPKSRKMKSFAIESLAMTLFRNRQANGLFANLVLFFDFIANVSGSDTAFSWKSDYGVDLGRWKFLIPDPSGVTRNVCKGLDEVRAEKFVESSTIARDRLIRAAESVREDTAERYLKMALKFD